MNLCFPEYNYLKKLMPIVHTYPRNAYFVNISCNTNTLFVD